MSRKSKKYHYIPNDIGEIIIDLFSEKTKLPILFYEEDTETIKFFETSKKYFSDFCAYLHSCGVHSSCLTDHLKRASECYEENITMCWMGLSNAAAPIFINNERKAVLLYGQKRLNNNDSLIESENRFNKALVSLNINETQRRRLVEKFNSISLINQEEIDPEQLDDFKKLSNWVYSVIFDKLNFEKDVKQVSHELSLYLQAVTSKAENHYKKILKIGYGCPNLNSEISQAKELLNAVLRMNVVVDNFGKFLGGYEFKPISLKKIINGCVDIYHSFAKDKGIIINVNGISSKFPMIKASERHIKHAFNNLIHNAVKYSHKGFHRGALNPVSVDIDGWQIGDSYVLNIKNFGVGILPEEINLGKIFQDGYTGKLTKNEYRTGGGYGLKITKEICEKHNIQFDIESKATSDNTYLTKVSLVFKILKG